MKYLKKFENYDEYLGKLHISERGLVDFPDEFLPLNDNLIEIDCSENRLTELPELPLNLEDLDCRYNELSYLPTLPKTLIKLYCIKNEITELPELPPNLKILMMSQNLLSELPELPKSLIRYSFSDNNWIKPVNYKIWENSGKIQWKMSKSFFYTDEQIKKFKSYEFQKSFMEETPFEWKDLDVKELGLHEKIKEEFDFIFNYDSYKID